MNSLNKLKTKKFYKTQGLLSTVDRFRDKRREKAIRHLLRDNKELIKGSICIDAGCGLGYHTEYLLKLGASKVYAVEPNSYLNKLSRKHLKDKSDKIVFVNCSLNEFDPGEPVDLLFHDFFGPLLYDQELFMLESLKFNPRHVIPNGGRLLCGTVNVEELHDPVVHIDLIKKLKNTLVSNFFDKTNLPLDFEICRYRYGEGIIKPNIIDVSEYYGNLLYFGVEVTHLDKPIFNAGSVNNYPYVWTYRHDNLFILNFEQRLGQIDVHFEWLND